jgi:low affinity Fe/Cu permease
MKSNFDLVFTSTMVLAIFTAQPFMFLLALGLLFVWEDAKWPAFDSKDYDQKMMYGPLKPWSKGN